jgi:hypothetical protein
MNSPTALSLSQIYRWPLLVGLVIAAGLGAALSGNEAGRFFSCLALGVPLVVIVACLILALRKWR